MASALLEGLSGHVSAMCVLRAWEARLGDGSACDAAVVAVDRDDRGGLTWPRRPGSFVAFVLPRDTPAYCLLENGAAVDRHQSRGSIHVCDRAREWTLRPIDESVQFLAVGFEAGGMTSLCAPAGSRFVDFERDRDEMPQAASALLALARGIVALAPVTAAHVSAAMEHMLHAFLIGLASMQARFAPDGTGTSDRLAAWQVRKATALMRSRLGEKISLPEVAGSCGLSPSYFGRLFKKSTGLSTHQWIIEQRVARARVLLASTDPPIVEVAHACGFADQTHFTRVFSRRMQMSPRVWRRVASCNPAGAHVPPSGCDEPFDVPC